MRRVARSQSMPVFMVGLAGVFFFLGGVISTSVTHAAGGTGAYTLPWNGRGQVLEYHSCGCADSCWKAEVIDASSKRVIATLRCDCEALFYSIGAKGREQSDPRTCAVLENKPVFIRETLEEVLKKPK